MLCSLATWAVIYPQLSAGATYLIRSIASNERGLEVEFNVRRHHLATFTSRCKASSPEAPGIGRLAWLLFRHNISDPSCLSTMAYWCNDNMYGRSNHVMRRGSSHTSEDPGRRVRAEQTACA